MHDIPEHVLKGGPWSMSKAGVIEKCSLQFDFKYRQKVKEQVTFEQSRVGVAAHKALELMLGGTKQKMSFDIAADENELTHDEREQLQCFWDQIARFVKRMTEFKQKHGVKEQLVLIERKWGVTAGFKKTGFFDKNVFFRGVLDYALPTARGDLIIIDHKSGKEKELEHYEKQFKGYCIMALAQEPALKGVQCAINFLQTDHLAWAKYVSADTIRDEYIPWLIEDLTKSCAKLLEPPAPTKGWFCNWCGYKPICQAHGGTGRVEDAAQ